MKQQLDSSTARRRKRVVRAFGAVVVAYWVGLAAFALWPPVRLFVQLRRQWPGRVALAVSDEFGFAVRLDGRTVWHADLTGLEAAAWIVGPPLVLWLVWLVGTMLRARSRSARADRTDAVADAGGRVQGGPMGAVGEGAPPEVLREREGQPAAADRAG